MKKSKPIVKERESGIELLRIILMLQVIYLHVSNFGEVATISRDIGGYQEVFFWINMLICRSPVYIFMLISGYFSVTSKENMRTIWKKAAKVYAPMIFYSIVITTVLGATGLAETYGNIIRSFIPLTSGTWYFMSVYLLVLILSPVVNLALNKLSKHDFKILLGVLFVLFSLWQVLAHVPVIADFVRINSILETTKGRGLDGFLFMYIIGAYLRLHTKREEKIAWKYLGLFFAVIAYDFACIYLLEGVPFLEGFLRVINFNNNPSSILQGIFLLMFFRTIRFKSRVINFISTHNLGVYMIHEHWLMRSLIWDKIFLFTQNVAFYSSPLFIIEIYGIIVAIYISCTLIDIIRAFIFDGVAKLFGKFKKKQ